MAYVYGIDLGTTYSCVSYIDEYGKAVVLKNSDGQRVLTDQMKKMPKEID